MALTKRQEAALRAAPPNKRNALRQTYQRQKPAKINRSTAVRQTGSQRVIRTPMTIPRGLEKHHFDAFASDSAVQPLSFSIGPATPIRGHNYHAFTSVVSDRYLISFNVGGGRVAMSRYTYDYSAGSWLSGITTNMASAGFEATGPSASSPMTFMATRGSIRLRNCTKASDVAGVVRVLRVASGVVVSSNQDELVNLVHSSDRTRTFSAIELCATHQWDQIPVSQDKYHAFVQPGVSNTDYETLIGDPGMSTIFFMIEATLTPQDWEFSLAGTYYARYRVVGPLTNAYRLPPTVPLAITNAVRDAAEKVGAAGMKVAGSAAETFGGYLGAMLAQRGAAIASRTALTGVSTLALMG